MTNLKRKGSHGHDPALPDLHATFVAWGSGIKHGARLGEISNMDVAPTIARLLGFSIPNAEGKALKEVFWKNKLPVRRGELMLNCCGMANLKRIKCPSCKKEGAWFDGSYGPFCSKRCKNGRFGESGLARRTRFPNRCGPTI